jgi:hypothetical protein
MMQLGLVQEGESFGEQMEEKKMRHGVFFREE